MYSTQSANGMGVDAGTINPAALNQDTSPRGLKRSRSPDNYGDVAPGDDIEDDGDSKHIRKRGRPMKPMRGSGVPESPSQSSMSLSSQQQQVPLTPQSQTASLPPNLSNTTPTQSSPPKTTPKSVIKALPTVRDHTTDQLGQEGDEYIPREYDDQGEKKVTSTGHLLANREYRCRTFFVPNRGDKLFMLATECARVLGYRDSYLLFNKNRSLYKIIATQAEKEDLISQEILPFSYRSRQIAIVTAKSMFRQFGSRVIINGRRVRDDYWEGKARKQGFTEEDLAGEKRPGAAKARDAAAAEASATASLSLGHQGDIVYSNHPNQFGGHPQPQTVQPGSMMGANPGHPGQIPTLPMITLAPEQPDMRVRDYSSIQRPRQEISGQPYQDRTQSSLPTEHLTQAHQAVEYNKQISAQRSFNHEILNRRWTTPHVAESPQQANPSDILPSVQVAQSPRTSQSSVQQSTLSQQQPQHMMAPQSYTQPPRQQNSIAQSPLRGPPQAPNQIGGPGLSINSGNLQGGSGYGYSPQGQMWPPPQQSPSHTFPSYNPHSGQQSPHIQQSPQHPPPQLRHSGSNPQMPPGLQYPGMRPPMGQNYPPAGQSLYPSQSQQYMQQASAAGPQPGAESWSPQQQPGPGGQWGWPGQQQ